MAVLGADGPLRETEILPATAGVSSGATGLNPAAYALVRLPTRGRPTGEVYQAETAEVRRKADRLPEEPAGRRPPSAPAPRGGQRPRARDPACGRAHRRRPPPARRSSATT